MRDSDLQVVAAVRAGDREAFRWLVDRHRETLFGVLVRLLADRDAAEELTQATFVRAYTKLDSFRGEARFSTWLVQIGVHLVRDRLRRRSRRSGVVSLEEQQERGQGEDAIAALRSREDPEADLDRKERRELLLAALRTLPPAYREVLVLRHFGDLPYARIAAMVGDSEGTLKVRAHRARRMLRDAVAELVGREEPAPAARPGSVARVGTGGGS